MTFIFLHVKIKIYIKEVYVTHKCKVNVGLALQLLHFSNVELKIKGHISQMHQL
jgi:hypothetical protein